MQQFISDMENLHRQTKDENFSIIIVDFESEDMDVEQALRESSVPRSVWPLVTPAWQLGMEFLIQK